MIFSGTIPSRLTSPSVGRNPTRLSNAAGARTAITSLWKVDDRPTSELMQRLYERMLRDGRTPSSALREAKLELLRGGTWKAPYYWAAFQLYGEWR